MTGAGQDYFEVLGVPHVWHLDTEFLAARHLALSRELHPDRFAQASPRERIMSLERTTAVNDAYRTLRDPIRRAEYLLRQHRIGHLDQDLARGHEHGGTDPDFLAEIMQIREQMLDQGLAGGQGREAPAGRAIRADAVARIAGLDAEIDRQFTVWEADPAGPGARAALLAVDRCLARRRYFVNIVREIDGEEAVAGHGKL
jgi:molecular chaperone HscB